MIIRHGFNLNRNSFNKRNELQEQKIGLKKSIDNLDNRYKSGQIDIDKFKKIANNYADQHKDLNSRINKGFR